MSDIAQLNTVCPSCQREIQRNSAVFDDQLFHWGCLKNDEQFGNAIAQCRSCGSWLTQKGIVQVQYPEGTFQRVCGNCGHQFLCWLKKPDGFQERRREIAEVVNL